MHFLGSIMVSLLFAAITVSASAGKQLIERKAAKTAEPFHPTLDSICTSSSQGSSTTDVSIKILNDRAPAFSRETSAASRPATDPATRPVPLRQGLIPWCGNMLGLTGPLCMNYCSCNSYHVITCSEGLKGMTPIERDIHSVEIDQG